MSYVDIVILSISLLSLAALTIQHFVYKRKIKKLQEQDLSSLQQPSDIAQNVIVHYYDEHGGDDLKAELQESQQEVEQLRKRNAELKSNTTILEQKIDSLTKKVEKDREVNRKLFMEREAEMKHELEYRTKMEAERRMDLEKDYKKRVDELKNTVSMLEKELDTVRKAAPKSDNVAIQELEKQIHQLYADQKQEKAKLWMNFEAEKRKILDTQAKAIASKGNEIALLRQTIEKQLEEINRLKNK